MTLDKQFIFIIGSPRSGTTWLQIMLSAHPAVCTSVELTLFDKYIPSWIKIWNKEKEDIEQGRWQKGLPFLWSKEEFSDFLDIFLEKVYEKVVITNPQATHILDKNPLYVYSQDLINQFLPHARFVHILRDGRDVVSSLLAARRDIGFGPGSVEEAASLWRKTVLEGQKGKRYKERYLEVRYEELLTNGPNVLGEVFDFSGLQISNEDLTSIFNSHTFEKMKMRKAMAVKGFEAREAHYRKGKEGSWREDLNSWQKFIVNEIAGDLLFELGYINNNNWWADTRQEAVVVPLKMAVSTRKHMMKRSKEAMNNLFGSNPTKPIGN